MIMPKLVVSNYPEMLRKLSTAFWVISAICIFVLRSKIPELDLILKKIDVVTPDVSWFWSIKVPLGTLLPALVLAILSESVRLHDKISTLFGIRKTFDTRWILIPLAALSGASLNANRFDAIRLYRDNLMREVFYKYVSNTSSEKAIDSHEVDQALTNLSWYWICVEAIFTLILSSIILLVYKNYEYVLFFVASAGVIFLLKDVFILASRKYADNQVKAIVGDTVRKAKVAAAFHAV